MEKFDDISPPPDAPPPMYTDSPSSMAQGFGYDQPGGISGSPVLQQPGSVHHTTVIVNQQPMQMVETGRDWNSGLCGCMTDCESCCCTMFCALCYLCSISSEMREDLCLPCCVPTPTVIAMLRQKLRMQEKIHGNIKGDYCVSCCCAPCAICQLKREMNYSRSRLDAHTQLHG